MIANAADVDPTIVVSTATGSSLLYCLIEQTLSQPQFLLQLKVHLCKNKKILSAENEVNPMRTDAKKNTLM